MKYLLDTHVLLWARLDPHKLSDSQRAILTSSTSQKFVSAITIWEISLKFSLGKLELGGHTPEEFMLGAYALGFQAIAPTFEQLASFHRLPKVVQHKDPFDRMLIWQAVQSNFTLLSSDKKLSDYAVHGLVVS